MIVLELEVIKETPQKRITLVRELDKRNIYIKKEQNDRVYYKGAHFTAGKDEYLPIPLAQYNFSEGTYVQNPGYGDF